MKQGMDKISRVIISVLLAKFLHISHGCQMEGHGSWILPVQQDILDTFRGAVISRTTTNILAINSISYGEATINGPYFDLSLVDSLFEIRTNAAFDDYEENEVASILSVTVNFSCTGGTSSSLLFSISITDTNNNAPRFTPTDAFEFVVAPPLPPGFLVTGCFNDITARDIDLTTQRIDYTIEDNPYFEIAYDASSSTVAKEFKATLRTTTFIRSLSEPITLTITATDVDLTGDPPLSTTATVRIVGDSEFQFPEEPIFAQTFYLANYTEDHQLNLLETISLQQGFDEFVNFTLEGEYAEFFTLNQNGNQLTFVVMRPIPDEIWPETQIFLIVRASREFTSGDAATVIVQLPEEVVLMFERVYYEGTIINNSLQLSPLVLSQGYDDVTNATVVGEYSTYFTATAQGNLVTVTMSSLSDDIINDNTFITLQVVARTDRGEVSTVVNLEIIKDDNVTPVFDKSIYNGTYDPVIGLTAEQIIFVQGFDETVSIELVGDDAHYFQYSQNGYVITLTSSAIPPELYSQRSILISIIASKPRTVGANAAIRIVLPEPRLLEFEETTYRGTIEGDNLSLQTVILSSGYEDDVTFDLTGEYVTYFTATNEDNQVVVSLSSPLPETVITQNNVIMLTLTASGLNAVTTSTSILLNIIKEDTTTPIFSRSIYFGTYSGQSFEMEPIYLSQGFGNDVSFRIDGDHSQYFEISNDGNSLVITLRAQIPEDIIFNQKVLIFNVLAEKALTVGANAAVLIRFPTELTDSAIMRFSKNTYIGALEENEINLENIVLHIGFAAGTEFILGGEYAEHFALRDTDNVIQISSLNTLPNEVIDTNDFVVLDIEARRQRAVSVWTSIVIDIVKQEVIAPVFNQAYYTGVYTENTGLTFEETINLVTGYDATVEFDLAGDSATWFSLIQENNTLSLTLDTPIPREVLENSNNLLFTIIAIKPNAITGRAVISIDLPKDFTDSSFRFHQDFYKGYIENSSITLNEVILGDYTNDVVYTFIGDYEEYFQLTNLNGSFTLQLISPLPTEILAQTNVILFTLEARNTNIRTHTVLIVEIVRSDDVDDDVSSIVELIFTQTFYSGTYDTAVAGLSFPTPISLTQGYDSNVEFDLEGDNSQWFGLVRDGNSVTVTLTSPIPAAVIANNQQLVFVVTAQSPGSATARATVIISLLNEYPEGTAFLGFDRVSYFGTIENNETNIPAITLTEGFSQDVAFTLHGELNSYFSVSNQEAVVTIVLQSTIPEHLVPANRIIVLEIQAAAPQSVTAYATIILEYVVDDDVTSIVELIFTQTFYSGTYDTTVAGLSFPTPISLTQGYDSNVEFDLEGDNSQWFGLVRDGNSVTVTLSSPIPAAVIANNQQLVFVVTAQSPGSATARATVIISLLNEYPEGTAFLGFDRVSYFGTIENNETNIPAITLTEGFSQDVAFTLHGELNSYFSVSNQEAVVTIVLQSTIPEHLVPANRIIVLKIQAAAPQSVTAYATIILEYVVDDDVSSIVELIFTQTFYSGTYDTAVAGLSFLTPISLTQGYDSNVEFDLEGDNSQWFGLVRDGNSVTVTLSSPIPAAVIANNQQLVFVVTAQSPGSATARATVIISLLNEYPEGTAFLGFDRVSYFGTIENNETNIPAITLTEGFSQDVAFTLHGELNSYFSVSNQEAVVTIVLQSTIPEHLVPANRIIVLEIQAAAPQSVTAYATIILEYVVDDDVSSIVELIFTQTFYSGTYDTAVAGLSFLTPISLTQGYDSNVEFDLEGDNSQWFGLVRDGNSVTVTLTSPIPAAVIANNQQLVFVVTAQSPGSATARTTVIISLLNEYPEGTAFLGFDRVSYFGTIENNETNIPAITLTEGFSQDVAFTLHGELNSYFSVSNQEAVVTIVLQSTIPEHLVPANRIIVLEIQAAAPQSVTAYATIILEYVVDDDVSSIVELIFTQTFYSGTYDTAVAGLSFLTPISLTQGYDSNVEFDLEGDNSQWFGLVRDGNSVTVTLSSPIPAAVIANNQQLVFVVTAQSPGSATARATVIISLLNEYPEGTAFLGFDRVSYFGTIENNETNIPAITLTEGFSQDVAFTLHGELNSYFSVSNQEAVVTIVLQSTIPEHLVPANRIIVLEIQAAATQSVTAYATIILEYVVDDDVSSIVELIFTQTFYSGTYDTAVAGLSFPTPISLTQGYDSNVEFDLEGDKSQWFGLVRDGNSVIVTLTSPIPAAVIANNQQLVFVVTAQSPGSATARATIIIEVEDDSHISGETFEKVLYEGILRNGVVNHETITVTGFSGSTIELRGEYSSFFISELSNEVVTVRATDSLTLPPDVTHVALELHAGTASAVLVLNVITDQESLPTVTFSSSSYAITVDIARTGFIGQVEATADNGEAVTYSLNLDDPHLQERLSISNDGELHLSAPVNFGFYEFRVVAATVNTQSVGTATVHLSAEAITVSVDEHAVAPLIVIDVDEEEPHYDLINGTQDDCHYTLTNRWPEDQTWVYVDEQGLHTRPIDREHESIAFMALSQIQVELTLHCDGDAARSKRAATSEALGPYDYGNKKWILTDTISYNSRRSFVNVIVNDINDNYPIFVEKANEPVTVGYPVPELAERVLPRSLAELQATDADIDENAALVYWSSEPELAVARSTGFVHLRDGATLEDGAIMTVYATDRNGEGLTGSINLLVRLLDETHIAVVTVRDAFLDDEQSVLSYLTEAVGYEIKTLRSAVISDEVETNDENSRKTRDISNAEGASLQMYVYGLIAQQPVTVDQLTTDINNIVIAPVTVARTVSLQDHLEGQTISAGRATGLLVSTIILSVLLFIVLVLIAVWFFLRWRKNRNYDQFSEENSLTSRDESVDRFPKPEPLSKPRLDIAELKKSERRLQEMLDAPIRDITVDASTSRNDAIVDIPVPEPTAPIVIQSIDKLKDASDESEDEFGEAPSQAPKRKSVVTFNENVEKIIHVEDRDPDNISEDPEYEIYKL